MFLQKKMRMKLLVCMLLFATTSGIEIETSQKLFASSSGSVSNGTNSFALESMYDNFTCAPACTCQLVDFTQSRYAVQCSDSRMRDFPALLTEDLHQVQSMTLLRTAISKIDSIRMYSNLMYLNVNQSLIQALDSGLATSFPALESLHIAGSRLSQMSQFSLRQHPVLKEVDFSFNQLVEFDSAGSASLRTLNLRSNLFTSLDSVSAGFSSLSLLDAAQNKLTLAGLMTWQPPPELEVLNLSGNQLGQEPDVNFISKNSSFISRLQKLQQLDLSSNRLSSLRSVTAWLPADSRLWKLSLGGNPLVCDCELYRDKERLARQGVVIADTPLCRLANGSSCPLMRLGSWACDIQSVTTPTPPDELGSASMLQLPAALALTAAAAVAVTIVLIGSFIWICRKRRRHNPILKRELQQQRQQQQQFDAEYPYNTASVKSTNLTGSLASVATNRSGLPYAIDLQKSRVFSRKLNQQSSTELMGSRCQSEQVLGRGSTPLPPIPDVLSGHSQHHLAPKPEDYSYVDMGGAGYTYEEIRAQPQPPPPPPPPLMIEGYVDMNGSNDA